MRIFAITGRRSVARASRRRILPFVVLPALIAFFSTPRVGADAVPAASADLSLTAHWPLDEASGTAAGDVAGDRTGTVFNGSWTIGRHGGGLQLDGASAYVDLPTLDLSRFGLTLAAWVRFSDFGSSQQILAKATGASEQASYWTLGQVQSGGRNLLRFQLKAGTQTTTLVASTGDLVIDRWHHAAATFDGAAMRLFLDGVEVASTFKSGTVAVNSAVPLNIGRNPGGSEYLSGIIDDVRIYERALKAREIAEVMDGNGAPDTEAPTTPSLVQAFPQSPSSVQVRWGASTDDTRVTAYRVWRDGALAGTTSLTWFSDIGLQPATTYHYTVSALDAAGNESTPSPPAPATTFAPDTGAPQLSAITVSGISENGARITWSTDEPATTTVEYGVNTSYGLSTGDRSPRVTHLVDLTGLESATTYHYRVVSADRAGNVARSTDLTFTTAPSAPGNSQNPKDQWRLDEGTGLLAMDSSGGVPASLKGGAAWTAGRSGYGIDLNGTTAYLLAANIDVAGTGLTLASWARHTSVSQNVDQAIISKALGSNEQSHYWSLAQVTQGSRRQLQFRLKTSTGTTTLVASMGNIPIGEWYHAAGTYDGSTMRVYLNGLEVGRAAKSGGIVTAVAVAVNIGRNPAGSGYLHGALDDVRIYDRALNSAGLSAIIEGDTPANAPPSVAMTSPVSGARFTPPATVLMTATASDPENRLTDVRFYNGTTLLATDTVAPFTFSWLLVPAGNYVLTAVARDADGGVTTSEPVPITVESSANQQPVVTLTSPGNGATFVAPATILLTASASDPENRLSDVRFFNGGTLLATDTTAPFTFSWPAVLPGTYVLTAIARDTDGGSTTSAPATITVHPNQSPTVALTAPANGANYSTPATVTLNASASDPENRLADVRFYQGSTLLGTDTAAPFTFTWSGVPAGSYSLTAVVRDLEGGSATSVPVTITVQSPNQPPTVTLTAPVNGATFTPPASVVMTANAADPENRLQDVRFYNGGTLLATDTAAPFSFTWSSVPAGNYTLTAVARDLDGASTTSASVTISVNVSNQPPSVALTAPANGATFTAPATVTLSANAADPENRLQDVRFFNGATLLATDPTAPFTFSWTSVGAGTHTVTAIARDMDGLSATSTAVTITVQPGNQSPTVALATPTNGATFTAPAAITLTGSASDPENRMSDVRFFSGSTLLGTDTSAPYTFVWSGVPAGTYTLSAVARDLDGGSGTSTPVTITVVAPPLPWRVAFGAAIDHDTNVDSYILDIFASGANPATDSPVQSSDLGKPVPDASRDIIVDRTTLFYALPGGNYILTVRSVSAGGTTRSTPPVAFTR